MRRLALLPLLVFVACNDAQVRELLTEFGKIDVAIRSMSSSSPGKEAPHVGPTRTPAPRGVRSA